MSRSGALLKINEFFLRRDELEPEEVKKMKRLAMKHRIRLGEKRRRFCSECFSDLKFNTKKTRVTKTHKIVECGKCGKVSKWKIS